MDGSEHYTWDQPKYFSYIWIPNDSNQFLPVVPSANLINLAPANLVQLRALPRKPNQENLPFVHLPIPAEYQKSDLEHAFTKKNVPILPKKMNKNCKEKQQNSETDLVSDKRVASVKTLCKKELAKLPGVSCHEIVEVKILTSEKSTTMSCEGYNFNWKNPEKTR